MGPATRSRDILPFVPPLPFTAPREPVSRFWMAIPAWAASGHATAVPPSRVMNSRLTAPLRPPDDQLKVARKGSIRGRIPVAEAAQRSRRDGLAMNEDILIPFHPPAVARKNICAAFDGGCVTTS